MLVGMKTARPFLPSDRPDPLAVRDDAVRSLARAAIATGLGKLDTSARPGEHARRAAGARIATPISSCAPRCTGDAGQHPAARANLGRVPGRVDAGMRRGRAARPRHRAQFRRRRPDQRAGHRAPGGGLRRRGAAHPGGDGADLGRADASPYKLAVITTLSGEMMRVERRDARARGAGRGDRPGARRGLALDRRRRHRSPGRVAQRHRPARRRRHAPTSRKRWSTTCNCSRHAIAPVAGNGQIAWSDSPDAAVGLALRMPSRLDWPVLTSASLAPRTVIAVAVNALVSAVEGAPLIDASAQAEFHRDTAPAARRQRRHRRTPVGSLYQTDQVALRLRWPISWALRDPRAVPG